MSKQSFNISAMTNAINKISHLVNKDYRELLLMQSSLNKQNINKFFTNTTNKIAKTITYSLEEDKPDINIYLEQEYKSHTQENLNWIISPMNGGINFINAIPDFCIAISLQNNNDLLASVIYNPVTEDFFTLDNNNMCMYHKYRMRVSVNNQPDKSLLAVYANHKSDYAINNLPVIASNFLNYYNIKSPLLNLCWLTCGKYDAFIGQNLSKMEIKIAKGLLKTCGGYLTEIQNKKDSLFIASNAMIHSSLMKLIENNLK